ncbi:shikimate kinase [Hymenobacter saemangeumensis]|uniref:Shikimate kinase n=1 Tax=Hymenobacter saemangeumensis TaxID=1084522 RepID=A0ABP8IDP8_9BACT
MKLSLIGLPGSGKTTLGRQLAAHFGLPFLDLDAEIEAQAGRSIPQIFAGEGEAAFRQLEAAVLRTVLAQPQPLLLATGGGTPCFHGNMAVLNEGSFTLWLDVPVPVLAARLQAAEGARRPLLATAGNVESWLNETLAARQGFYKQARLRYPGTASSVSEVAAQLVATGFTA